MSLDTTVSPLFPATSNAPTRTHTIYLALSSNLGDRRGYLSAALQALREVMTISVVSSLYETEPVGYLAQPKFLTIVCRGETELSAQEFWQVVQEIETRLGREFSLRNGTCPLDIAILLYDELLINEDKLVIPHPGIAQQAFVLAPLVEIAPDLLDPVSQQRVEKLLAALPQDGVQKIANNLRIALDNDIQSGKPAVHVRLGRAGVVSIRKAILIGDEEHAQWFDTTFDLYADLSPQQAGVHMSRFSDALEEVIEEVTTNTWPQIELLAEHIARTILERQHVSRAEVSIRTMLPVQKWTPVSGRRTQEMYGLLAQAVATQEGSRHLIGVEVQGMVACPCAQDMVRSYTRLRLQEEGVPQEAISTMLDVTPLATHNQRGRATLLIGTEQRIEAKDLISLVEGAMSSENYALLKRPDELYIVNKAHSHPRFVEDVAREILRAVVERYTELDDDSFVCVRQRNEETIHKYDVEAEGWGTLGELRAEILHHAELDRHTTKEVWLNRAEA